MAAERKTAFISSTSIDLPEHRQKVIEACLESKFFPDGMEHWPAADVTALDLCLKKVDACDVFIGIYGHRYGWIPPGQTQSITELEYDHAVTLGKPRLLFVMGENHLIVAKDKDSGASLEALERFKARLSAQRVRDTFDNPDQLKSGVLAALQQEAILVEKAHSVDGALPLGAKVPQVNLKHLSPGAPVFLGREVERAALDAAWADSGKTHVLQLIAPGGTGKTSLVTRWLDKLRFDGWRGAERVFGWSFFNQGSGDARQASEDVFFDAALKWFNVTIAPAAFPWEKGEALADEVARQRSLLILDGLEPLQFPPTSSALAGELKAPGLQTLLRQLAGQGQPGLVLVTSREHLADLAEWVRNGDRPEAGVVLLDLGNLADADGARLLHRLGVTRAGAAEIPADDEELRSACREVRGHALTLSLLGTYLAKAKGGDVRRIADVDFARANNSTNKGQAFHVIGSYETWFRREGEGGARELAALELLGFFDRPATRENLAALRAQPAIPGLTEALANLDDDDWNLALSHLTEAGLAMFDAQSGSLDAHSLVREYMADALRTRQPEAWREGHRRLYEQLKAGAPYRPEGLAGLQPLFQAVGHGCFAGLQQEAFREVLVDRISRGNEVYAKRIGAFGDTLGAIAHFFDPPWRNTSPRLDDLAQAWLPTSAAFCLRALGRIGEALELMQAGEEKALGLHQFVNAAASIGNASELRLILGQISSAIGDARTAVAHAHLGGDTNQRIIAGATLAEALARHGEAAAWCFAEAEALQAESQPGYGLLYSQRGFNYCGLLLAPVERAAWARCLGLDSGPPGSPGLGMCREVARRAKRTLVWATRYLAPLDVALDQLSLARCTLYTSILQGRPAGQAAGKEAHAQAERALAGLRAACSQEDVPTGLLTRAWTRHSLGDEGGARADLDEAWQFASRGNMKLHMADIHLHRARLFRDTSELAKARALIFDCEYFRRLPELEDGEKALGIC